jgi:WD40 repeat protein
MTGCVSETAKEEPPSAQPPPPPEPPKPAATLRLAREIASGLTDVLGLGIDASANRAAAGGHGNNDVVLLDLDAGREIKRFKGHASAVTGVAMTPDGNRIASCSRDKTVRVWDVESGKEVAALKGHGWPVLGVAIRDDGRQVLSASDGYRLWDVSTAKVILDHRGHAKTVWDVNFSKDGSRHLTGSWDETMGQWDAASGKQLGRFRGHKDRVKAVRYLPGEERAVSACTGDPGIRVWDIKRGALLATLPGHAEGVMALAVSPDGKSVASGGGKLRADGGYDSVADSTVRLWDVASGALLAETPGHRGFVTGLAFSADGKKLVSAGGDGLVKVWSIEVP